MKNRKLYQLLMASVISATVLTSGIGVSAADFSDSAVETSVSEDETPVAEERRSLVLMLQRLLPQLQ